MSALQYSFNNTGRSTEGQFGDSGYFKSLYAFGRTPANQFTGLMSVETHRQAGQHETPHEREDHLMLQFLAFFVFYVICRIML
jgi:hypothetical protein